jgi:hypothetical protein
VRSADEAMVWIVGHETWHYLCKTRQLSGNWETRANRFGFEWLREFQGQTRDERPWLARLVETVSTTAGTRLKVVYG